MNMPTADEMPMPGDRAHEPDALELAYRRAVDLAAGDGAEAPRPAPRVRAAVLAAAQAVADEAREAPARPSLEAAPPPVGLGRVPAANRPSWRLRAGAAACVMVLTSAASWQFYEASRAHRQLVASASPESPIRILPGEPPAYAPQELPPPALPAAASLPLPADSAPAAARPAVPAHAPVAPPVAVAQADVSDAAPPESRAEAAKRAAPARPIVVAEATVPPASPAPVFAPPPAPAPAPMPQATGSAQASARDAVVAAADAPAADTARDARSKERPRGAATDSLLKSAEPATAGALSSSYENLTRGPVAAAAARPARLPTIAPTPVPVPPLQRAADSGDAAGIAQLLAQPGVAVDAPDGDGRTALLQAVLARRPAAVKALLAAGADPMRADRVGLTPRAAAQQIGDAELATLLAPH